MSIKPKNKNKINVGRKEGEKDRFTSQISLMDTSDRLTEEYLDRYKGCKFGFSLKQNQILCLEKPNLCHVKQNEKSPYAFKYRIW